ncbi:6187_t:CDS:2 [Dentiscutata heterogama]|uniref:6187_t:CDS:1 n=1 Tax=Dentiscutata heterogama TaxID=1316150 RepID=A0ACA9N0Q9_9GLOM|nr:6187_t:CDS:2 [Dentiscutata heterogama]
MERITVEYYRAGTPYLPPEAIEEIIQSQGTIKNACKEMVDKYASMPKNNISNERTKKKRSSSRSIHFSHLSSNSGEKIRKISENIINDDIPNTDIVAQIEREIKRKDKNLASSARIKSTT